LGRPQSSFSNQWRLSLALGSRFRGSIGIVGLEELGLFFVGGLTVPPNLLVRADEAIE
jgi:hypothetical protein